MLGCAGKYENNNGWYNYSVNYTQTSSGVIINDLNETYWKNKFIGGGRVVK